LTAILNLVGAVVTTQFLHAEVANTVGSLVAPAGGVAMSMLIAVLFGAITWNLFTWRAGLPSSSSHALIGALIGMGLAVYGLDAVQWGEVYPVLIALVTSPVVGLLIAYVLTVVLSQPVLPSTSESCQWRVPQASALLQRFRCLQPRG
jgi:phosphate/sulfate permease